MAKTKRIKQTDIGPAQAAGGRVVAAKGGLYDEVRGMIAAARERVAVSVNAELSMLYWRVGQAIRRDVLGHGRADYGQRIVVELACRLSREFGDGWSVKTLRHCLRAAETMTEDQIVSATRRQLSWTHIKSVLYIDDALKREFYLEMCIAEHWSTRTLQDRIGAMMYERTAIAKKPEDVIRKDLAVLRKEKKMSAELAFRDPYFLDFLGLHGAYSEKDLEKAMIADMKRSILELGGDMAFVYEQKRITIDNEDYWLDLLFFHRRLRRLVAIDLKLDSFKAEYKGQMELYLRWLDKYARCPGEKSPIGLVLCSGKNEEHVKLLALDKSNIRVATYMTELPPKDVLEAKFRQAIEFARRQQDEAK